MTDHRWEPRLAAVAVELPEGVTPPGTRGRVLHAALELFSRRGFAGASIRDIAEAAGIRSATLYAHYPSKEHILAELASIGHEALLRRLTQAVLAAGADPAAQLVALVRAHVLIHARYPMLAVVANNELHALSPERSAPVLALRDQSRELLLDVLRRGVAAGAFVPGDMLLTATAIGSLGMRVAHWYYPDLPYTRERIADAYVEFALRIVGAATAVLIPEERG